MLTHCEPLNPIFFSIFDVKLDLKPQHGQFIDLTNDQLKALRKIPNFQTKKLNNLSIKDEYIELFLNKNLSPKVRSFLQLSLIERSISEIEFNVYLSKLYDFSCNTENYMPARQIARKLSIK